jgi:hemolysin-activating ACP:hemolysin acyltransferase
MSENLLNEFRCLVVETELDTEKDKWLNNALQYSYATGNYKTYHSENNRMCGYIAWANVSDVTYRRVQLFSVFPQFYYEWLEGGNLMVFDIVCEDCIVEEISNYLQKLKIERNAKLVTNIINIGMQL